MARIKPGGVLTRAADLIERDGWCQGGSIVGKKRCAAAAIGDVLATYRTSTLACRREIVGALLHATGLWSIPDWNDEPGRTKEEVVAALREAARRSDEDTQ